MLKNILLDLDGTIIDSKQCIFWVYKRLFAELGIIPPNEKELEKFIGPPVEEMLRRYVKNDEVRKYCDRFREIYKEVDLVSMNHPYDGIADVLSSLSKNYKLFVATTKNEPLAKKILELFKLDEYFVGIYGSFASIGRIEKSDVIKDLIKENSLNKSESLLIGDTIFDVEGAEKAEVSVALVKYGYGVESDFVNKKIAFYAQEVTNIIEEVEKYKQKNG